MDETSIPKIRLEASQLEKEGNEKMTIKGEGGQERGRLRKLERRSVD